MQDVINVVYHSCWLCSGVLPDEVVLSYLELPSYLFVLSFEFLQSVFVGVSGCKRARRLLPCKTWFVVVVSVWRVVLVNLLIELVKESQLQVVLDEERQQILYGEPLLHGLFRFTDGLQQDLSLVMTFLYLLALRKVSCRSRRCCSGSTRP